MSLYCGIDLHSNNNYISIIDPNDKIVFERKLTNNIGAVTDALARMREPITGIAIESTYNWYWLVDGLQELGYKIHLVNTSKVKQYEGLKYTDDKYDAYWLAHLMKLGILPTGYIFPKEMRAVRDLLRRRMQLVQQRTANILSIGNQLTRNTGKQFSSNKIKSLKLVDMKSMIKDPNIQLSIKSNINIMQSLSVQIKLIEKAVLKQVELKEEYIKLTEIDGIGVILALTIMLETGDITRFKAVGNYASYCRCVNSKRTSNDKKKGEGNKKNGNKYLAWAFVEVANHSMRFNEKAKRYYQKKAAKTKRVVALKALAHKYARACYYVIKNKESFDENRLFGC